VCDEDSDYLMHRMQQIVDQTGQPLSRVFLRDMAVSFLLAGRDTTANCLSWLFYALTTHPDVEATLLEELLQLGRLPTFDDFKTGLPYLQAVVSETLRLYPSGLSAA
jgi:cytochrome P450